MELNLLIGFNLLQIWGELLKCVIQEFFQLSNSES